MLLYNIDGPKGSGKSTLAKELSNRYKARLEYFDSTRVVTDSDFDINFLKDDVIFERGMLSYMIYGFLWNAQQEFEVIHKFNEMTVKTWTPMSAMHFDKLIETIKHKFIILYSSDSDLLIDRINSREKETGKGATDFEMSQIKDSNQLFKSWGEYFAKKYPDKILLIDVLQFSSVDEIIDLIERSN